jgi:2-polyprenyl-3-methyl-5-hydroxy-6-metoxy-1,4-benzoquinol methylase
MTSIILENRINCPLCCTHKTKVFIPFPEIPVVQCCNCGFIYSSKILSTKDLSSYYEHNFGSERQLQGQTVNASVNSKALAKLVDFKTINRILDVGTGYGFLLRDLCKLHQLDATGVELSHQEAEYAQNILNLNVIDSSLSNSGLSKNSYDLVTSFEVLEHITHPIEFIHEMTEYVKPGGHLLIMTDNFEGRMAKSLGAAFPKWIPHTHISHFSANTLRKTLEEKKELKVIKSISYTPWEILLRNAYCKLFQIEKTPSEAFNLKLVLESEMQSKYKYFALRKLINKIWADFSINEKMNGDLMYFLLQKV